MMLDTSRDSSDYTRRLDLQQAFVYSFNTVSTVPSLPTMLWIEPQANQLFHHSQKHTVHCIYSNTTDNIKAWYFQQRAWCFEATHLKNKCGVWDFSLSNLENCQHLQICLECLLCYNQSQARPSATETTENKCIPSVTELMTSCILWKVAA